MQSESGISAPIRFTYGAGGFGERRYPWHLPWRQLPDGLIERPQGGSWKLEVEGHPEVTVHSGEVLVIPRGVRHRMTMLGTRVMHTAWMMVGYDGLAGTDLLAAARIPLVLPRSTGSRLATLMTEARRLAAATQHGDLAALAGLDVAGFRVFEILLQSTEVRTLAPTDPDLDRLLPVLRHVEANLDKPLSASDLARQACLSPSRFYAVFKRVFGITPMAYVQDVRLRLAQRLLIATTRPVGEIAMMVGFASPYYFSRTFHRYCRTTPTSFREDPNWFRSGSAVPIKVGPSPLTATHAGTRTLAAPTARGRRRRHQPPYCLSMGPVSSYRPFMYASYLAFDCVVGGRHVILQAAPPDGVGV